MPDDTDDIIATLLETAVNIDAISQSDQLLHSAEQTRRNRLNAESEASALQAINDSPQSRLTSPTQMSSAQANDQANNDLEKRIDPKTGGAMNYPEFQAKWDKLVEEKNKAIEARNAKKTGFAPTPNDQANNDLEKRIDPKTGGAMNYPELQAKWDKLVEEKNKVIETRNAKKTGFAPTPSAPPAAVSLTENTQARSTVAPKPTPRVASIDVAPTSTEQLDNKPFFANAAAKKQAEFTAALSVLEKTGSETQATLKASNTNPAVMQQLDLILTSIADLKDCCNKIEVHDQSSLDFLNDTYSAGLERVGQQVKTCETLLNMQGHENTNTLNNISSEIASAETYAKDNLVAQDEIIAATIADENLITDDLIAAEEVQVADTDAETPEATTAAEIVAAAAVETPAPTADISPSPSPNPSSQCVKAEKDKYPELEKDTEKLKKEQQAAELAERPDAIPRPAGL